MRRSFFHCVLCTLTLAPVVATAASARADEPSTADELAKLRAELATMRAQQAAAQQRLERLEAPRPSPAPTFLSRKTGEPITFFTGSGELTIYGNLDVSFDASTKGIPTFIAPDGSTPAGNGGWMPDISTNISYVGIKGFQNVEGMPFQFVYQLETQLDISATAGPTNSNSQSETTVKGALTSRNSFIGISGALGSLKIGKTDSPYKMSTQKMNPFVGMWGDYAVIMGNTGGDNRVEFGTRLDHSIWYESPNLGGLTFVALFSPGQNRGADSEQLAAGESSCTGGNIPGSGGTVPVGCTDGGWDHALAASLSFERAGFLATAAYERHIRVNRTSDLATLDAMGNLVGYDPNDIADEDAMKLGMQYKAPWGTSASVIVERLTRYVPDYLNVQNERSRWGWWFSMSQEFLRTESVHFGWAHAMAANGDPGQHNTAPASGIGTANANNAADLLTLAYRHQFGNGFSMYANWALTLNQPYAHYDLGAGGRSVTTDCHDAQLPALGGTSGSPRCWAGGQLQGFSVGMNYKF
jgi:predicted porin